MSQQAGLPDTWVRAPLGSLLLSIEAGKSFTCDPAVPGPDDVGVMKVSAVTWGKYQENESKTCTIPEFVNESLFVHPGDLLFSRANTIELVGACVIVGTTTRKIMLSDKILRFKLHDDSWKSWVLYMLRSSEGRRQIELLSTGNQDSMRNIGQERIRKIQIPVAPLNEQRRIVAEIEKQFTRLDDAVATLERVKANLERARASVLKAAVEGRLVPTEAELARAEGRDFEPASVLLEQILEERNTKWSKGKYKAPSKPDRSEDASEGWTWATMDEITWASGYGTSVKCDYAAKGPAVLRIPNIQRGALDFGDIKFATDATALGSDGFVEAGDLLFVRTNGSLGLIGLGTVVTHSPVEKTWFASYLIRLRLCGPQELWRWIGLVWRSRIIRRYVERDAASSAGQFNVSLTAALTYQIPLPPLAEQQRIVAEVERRLTILDSIAATVDRRLASCTHMRQSILKRAFEGKLVPQDPSDEPASDLLARIAKPAKPRSAK